MDSANQGKNETNVFEKIELVNQNGNDIKNVNTNGISKHNNNHNNNDKWFGYNVIIKLNSATTNHFRVIFCLMKCVAAQRVGCPV